MLGANTLLSFQQINQSSLNFDGSVSASNKKVICRKKFFKQLTKFQVKKKGLIGLQDSFLPGSVVFFFFLRAYV